MRHRIASRGGKSFQVCVGTFGTGEYAGKIEETGIEEEGLGGRVVLVWACGGKDRALAGEWDNLPAGCRFGGQHVNQSRNRGWEKEGEGGELRVGGPGGVGYIEGTSRVHVE